MEISMRFWKTLNRSKDIAHDDYGRPHGSAVKGGSATALGMINIVLGSLVAFVGSWLILRRVLFDGHPGRNVGVPTVFMVMAGVSVLLLGVGFIVAGVGVVKRRPWGRILALVVAGFASVAVLVCYALFS
jgi:hypothetical protein